MYGFAKISIICGGRDDIFGRKIASFSKEMGKKHCTRDEKGNGEEKMSRGRKKLKRVRTMENGRKHRDGKTGMNIRRILHMIDSFSSH